MEIKKIFWTFFAVFFGFFIPFAVFYLSGSAHILSRSTSLSYFANRTFSKASVFNSVNDNLELVFVGDIMLGRGVESSILSNASGDFSYLFENCDFIKEADIAFGNLEGPVADSGNDIGNLYSFRFKPDALTELLKAGFDVLSVANNHAGDWGREAFEENVFRLKNEDVLPVGGGINKKDAKTLRIIEKKGIKIGFLGFSDVGPDWFEAKEDKSGISLVDDDFPDLIKDSADKVDVLVVSIHFGEEYMQTSNDRQKMLAREAIDSGAKIVAGHHPHVTQEIEAYEDGIIAYSLGNFIFDQNFSEETMEGMVLRVYLEGDEIVAVRQDKIKLDSTFRPELVAD